MDVRVCRFLRRRAGAGKYERFGRRFRDALDEGDGLCGECVMGPGSGANVVLFHTWGGDCRPASYFGYAPGGAVSGLVTDMYLGYERVVAVEVPGASPDGDGGVYYPGREVGHVGRLSRAVRTARESRPTCGSFVPG